MNTKDWRDRFENRILSRGLRYLREGKVVDLDVSDNKVTALVKGTANYHVEIAFKDGIPVEMYCTCPYAAGGERCKHMAAVMYAVDPEANTEKKQPGKKKNGLLSTDVDEAYILELKSEVDAIFRRHEDRSGFINYFSAMDFQIDIERFMDHNARALVQSGFVKEAFDFTTYVFLKLSFAAIDDDGEITSISSLCYDLWKLEMEASTPEERLEMKEWFLKYSEDESVIDYMQDHLRSFVDEEMSTEDDLRAKMSELDEEIDRFSGGTDCPSFTFGLSYEPAVILRMELMKKLGYSRDKIEEYRYAHRNFSVIRQQYMDEAENAGDWERLIELLEESKVLDEDSEGKLYRYSDKLIEAYRVTGNREKEKKERYWLFCNSSRKNVEEFYNIKELCDEGEWPEYKCGMIEVIDNRDLLCELYSSEQMLEELYETIFNGRDDSTYAIRNRNFINYFGDDEGLQKARTVKLLDRYGFLLASKHTPEILDAYEAWVRPIAETAKNSVRYEEILYYLQRMLHYDGGAELVKSLAEEWIESYPTRKLMVQRLEEFCSSRLT